MKFFKQKKHRIGLLNKYDKQILLGILDHDFRENKCGTSRLFNIPRQTCGLPSMSYLLIQPQNAQRFAWCPWFSINKDTGLPKKSLTKHSLRWSRQSRGAFLRARPSYRHTVTISIIFLAHFVYFAFHVIPTLVKFAKLCKSLLSKPILFSPLFCAVQRLRKKAR